MCRCGQQGRFMSKQQKTKVCVSAAYPTCPRTVCAAGNSRADGNTTRETGSGAQEVLPVLALHPQDYSKP